ncbi:phage holin [Bacillus inaquosorum]|uniref:phage holin n=1 Tax=Bacillus inaquosorum TaxID=483913 RepID=UPI0022825F11|nr:phage holin [Bacillus inaquosorum]MCY7902131.1 phage holin [Bacillus inaquosorum]MCY8261506.1 phage holin [Bacillus inaquosorum]MCY9015060.1 phage holin [Bacillus inaquosorum]MCY9058007.1 phage holin [Bacillus inaquosorum]MCY9084949.1 phage holin [Bacillus inaquosorum]
MTKINWKVRLKKKTFLVAIFSSTLLFAQAIASAFGYDLTVFGDELTEKFNALLTFLTAMGIIVDPTTQGISDSEQAMDYDSPR